MADNARAKKLADLIREVVAQKLQRGIKDPRLGSHVTITDTRVTGDLREATVFYTVYGDDEERASAAAGLESAKGILRSAVGAAAGTKFTPTLAFVPDALPENAKTIDDLLDKARASDAEVREVSSGAAVRRRGRPVPQAGRGRRRRGHRGRMKRESNKPTEGRAAMRSRQGRWRATAGLVIVDKPAGFTSHDVVAKMRGMARTRRVGHAGTLDPMATGVLVLGIERATKLLGHLALTEKEYVGTIRLGQTTITDDAEGEITASKAAHGLAREDIDAGVAGCPARSCRSRRRSAPSRSTASGRTRGSATARTWRSRPGRSPSPRSWCTPRTRPRPRTAPR